MADATSTESGQAPENEAPNEGPSGQTSQSEGQTPNPAPGQTPEGQPRGGSRDPPSWDMVRELREEAKATRLKLREFEDARLTAQERSDRELADFRSRAERAELATLRYEVAADKELPLSLAKRLQGATRRELEQDADKLKDEFGLNAGQTSRADFRPGARPPGAGNGDGDFNAMIRASAGRPV